MGMNIGGMNKMLRKMQADMARMQAELQERTVEGTAGGGSVRVRVSGSLEVRAVEIDPAAIDPDDPGFLADLVAAAVNDGLRRAQAMVAEEMGKITGGLKLPGMP
jgi:DNA-binding YbaB/EbfC family protein